MPEYLPFRCCMCPYFDIPEKTECPPFMGEGLSPCRFVKEYRDKRGNRYKVTASADGSIFKVKYQSPGGSEWNCYPGFIWRHEFDEAQTDLNACAKKCGWEEAESDGGG